MLYCDTKWDLSSFVNHSLVELHMMHVTSLSDFILIMLIIIIITGTTYKYVLCFI